MESKFQTSFIPKKSLDDGKGVKVKTPVSIFYLVAVLLILATLGASGTLYAYKYITQKSIDVKKSELVAKEKTFDYGAVQEVVRVDKKLRTAENLLQNHTAISSVFALLQEVTLQNLRFTSFNFSYLSKDKLTITMSGQAKSFGVVAKQAEAFASNTSAGNNFKDPIFSDLNVDETGLVTFSFMTSVNPELISYQESITQ